MKRTILIIFAFFVTVLLHAQVVKTVNVTAGGLAAALTPSELNTITHLTVTGTIDARDFKTIRYNMPEITVLDLSGAKIAAYAGADGVSGSYFISYPENELPGVSFFEKRKLTSVTLPLTTTSIEGKAFYYCTGLTSFVFPPPVTRIGNQSFLGCSGLTSLTLPTSLLTIEGGAFYECTGLTSVSLPSSVTLIGNQAFYKCTGLTSVTIPASATTIGNRAFECQSGFISVDVNNPNYSSQDGVLFDKNKTLLIHCPVSKSGSYSIPSTVTTINQFAFGYCAGLTSVTIPSSVDSIAEFAFKLCTGLISVNIPPLVKSIGGQTFYNCTALKSVSFPSSLISIGEHAYYNCSSLNSVSFPSSMKSLENLAFAYCTGLTSVNIPASVTSIGESAFLRQSGLIKVEDNNPVYSSQDGVLFDKSKTTLISCPISKKGSYSIPVSVTAIGYYAFGYCDSLTSVTIPSSVKSLSISAFSRCQGLTSMTIPSSVTYIGENAFYNCTGMKSLTLPSTVSSIGADAFSTCTGLKSVTVTGHDLLNLDNKPDIFYGLNKSECTLKVWCGLKEQYATASQWRGFGQIVNINCPTDRPTANAGSDQFVTEGELVTLDGSSSLDPGDKKLTYQWIPPAQVNLSSSMVAKPQFVAPEVNGDTRLAFTLTVNNGSANSKADTVMITVYDLKTLNLEAGSLSPTIASDGLAKLSSLKITGTIDARDFKIMRDNMPMLASVDLSDATVVAYTGDEGTVSGSFFYPPNAIPESAFQNKESLKTIDLPSTIVSIANSAFNNCTGLKSMVIPATVTNVGDYAFAHCSVMQTVIIPGSVTSLGDRVFSYSGLTSVSIPSSLTSVGSRAFYYCADLASVSIPSSVTTIGDYAFAYCAGLPSVTIPSSVTTIGPYAFMLCTGLKSVHIPRSVTSIGHRAFLKPGGPITVDGNNPEYSGLDGILFDKTRTRLIQCPVVKSGNYTIPSSVTTIGDGAFYACSQLTGITIPPSVTSIENGAFYNCSGLNMIYARGIYPVDLPESSSAFNLIDLGKCLLNVPCGAFARYSAAPVWKKFIRIIEKDCHFVPVWTGNGMNQMNINLYSAILDSVKLEDGDEIGLFDGNLCVGAGVVNGTITTSNILSLIASANDGTGNGFTAGHKVSFRFYDRRSNREIGQVEAVYVGSNPAWSKDGLFSAGATAFAELSATTPVKQQISLLKGWNLFSLNIIPPVPDMKNLFRTLINDGSLSKIQDEAGKSLEDLASFGGWKNNIGDIAPTEGYKIKVNKNCSVAFSGVPVTLPFKIPLTAGWNIIGYPGSMEADGKAVMQALINKGTLVKVQDEKGNSIENWGVFGGWVNKIGNLQPGKGYMVKVSANETLTIEKSYLKSGSLQEPNPPVTRFYQPAGEGNGTGHMNINLTGISSRVFQPGDEMAVFDGNLCVGAVALQPEDIAGMMVSIPVSASDGDETGGFTEGNPILLRVWNPASNSEFLMNTEIIAGPGTFRKHESTFFNLEKFVFTGITDQIFPAGTHLQIYPNPTTGKICLSRNSFSSETITIQVTNATGQIVLRTVLHDETEEIDLTGNVSGIYFISVTENTGTKTGKIVLNQPR